jgi:hypothetical protein
MTSRWPVAVLALLAALKAAALVGCGSTEKNSGAAVSGSAGSPAAVAGNAGAGGSSEAPDAELVAYGVLARAASDCAPKPSLEAALLARGTLDRVFASSYTAELLIGGHVSENAVVKSVAVRLTDAASKPLRDPYTLTATGFLSPSSDGSPSAGGIFAELLPEGVAAALPTGEVVVYLRVAGQTLGGLALESTELAFPIEICDGCLVTYPASARDPSSNGAPYQCLVAVDASTDPALEPCNLGIDEPFACTLCSATNPICQSPANNPSQ